MPNSVIAKTGSVPKTAQNVHVLLVDNKSAHLMRLQELIRSTLGEVTFQLHDPRDMGDADMEWADLVVFSGGWGRSIVKNPNTFNTGNQPSAYA
jgi:anthranilate/para-aminobenzoate synthase component II